MTGTDITQPTRSVGAAMRARIGLSAALATPFDRDGGVDWPRLAAHASRLLDQGMNVVTAFGTTGEGASIPSAVRATLHERMEAGGVRPAQLVECVYGPSSRDAGLHMRRSLEAGGAGILLVPPFYYKQPAEEGVYRWHAEAFEAAGAACRDVILYNIPGLTGVGIGPLLVARLRDAFPQVIAGVKDSSGDWDHTVSLLAEHRDIAILVGHEGHLAAAVRQGASGAISGMANVAPARVRRLVAGEDDPGLDAALDRLLELPIVPAIKALLAAQSGDEAWLSVRAPLLPITDADELALCGRLAAELG